ncbi:MAG: ABC transporter substrate-binding protein [Actinomycetota bacterium]|nr:ABC transporter substrate-binding protein [Actinomycetota bacterium]
MPQSRHVHRMAFLAVLAGLVLLAACGGGGGGAGGGSVSSQEPIRLGYSAWPGWFPWSVTEAEGLFEEAGVDVELVFFSDYLSSLDAMAAGQIDANSQTLNDTLVSVSAGSQQRVVLVNDNSAGNDAIIVDESIGSIEELAGRTVAAELGVVDHFLLLQGLESVGLSEEDVDFRGLPTDAAAAAFAAGEVDAVGVFAPFTLQALERPGSRVLFDSADFPGTIPDLLVTSPELVEERPDDVQSLVDAWYATLAHLEAEPEDARSTMASVAGIPPEEYESLEAGTRLFSAEEALAAFSGETLPEGLRPMAEEINGFLVSSGLAEEPAPLDGLFVDTFTADHLEGQGG